MIYTEKQRNEIEQVRVVFARPLQQSPDYELLWSDKVGYVWLVICTDPLYVDTATRIDDATDLCRKILDELATDVLFMTGNDHCMENADPLEAAEIRRRWKTYIDQLPEYAYLCDELLNVQK